MTTMQKLELMKEIDRRNAQRVADYQDATKAEASAAGSGDAA